MKTIIVTIGGTLTPGDLLMLSYRHPQRGGVSTLKYIIPQQRDEIVTDPATGAKSVKSTTDTIADVINGFINELQRGAAWPLGEFQGNVKDATSFVIKASDAVDDVEYSIEIEGAKTETMNLQVL